MAGPKRVARPTIIRTMGYVATKKHIIRMASLAAEPGNLKVGITTIAKVNILAVRVPRARPAGTRAQDAAVRAALITTRA